MAITPLDLQTNMAHIGDVGKVTSKIQNNAAAIQHQAEALFETISKEIKRKVLENDEMIRKEGQQIKDEEEKAKGKKARLIQKKREKDQPIDTEEQKNYNEPYLGNFIDITE